jgi:hypothetical protein
MSATELLSGAVAGFAGTVPMTVAMEKMFHELPPSEHYPLPPSEITERVEEEGLGEPLPMPHHKTLTLLSHFGYGTAIGTVYALTASKLPFGPVVNGSLFGLAVWAGSYLGWIPALGILSPATEHPPRRTALMIIAHLIWGSATGLLVDKLEPPDQGTLRASSR